MSQAVEFGRGGTGKLRSFWVGLGLTILTLGIYYYCWYYFVNDELKDIGIAEGDENLAQSSPSQSVIAVLIGGIVIVPPLLSIYNYGQRIKRAQRLAGVQSEQQINPTLAFLLGFPGGLLILPGLVHYWYVTKHQNIALRAAAGLPAEGESAVLMTGRLLRVMMGVVATIGLGVASYLTYIHYSGAQILCISGDPCKTVQTSVYSKLAGVPVALIGLIGYVLIIVSLLVPEREETRLAALVLTAVGFGFSVYLTGRELFSIHAICPWCVSSAVMMTILLILSVARFLRGAPAPAQRPGGGAAQLGARAS